MNDIKSLLIATTVLAIGGLGLYMYKSEDSEELDYNDDDFSESGSETASESTIEDLDLEELDYDDYKTKKIKKEGTKKNIKKNGGTRKKY
jgi:hypothetical protein